ncbi:MAG TPA: discoidin domain-containing protein [Candidatus Binatia bacterium]|jgi:hypothetical protein|nr:discoidin domain-containing protein [Candidatus Binatia bacterium]
MRGFAALILVALLAGSAAAERLVLDNFESAEGWSATASSGSQAQLSWERSDEGSSLRLDFNLANASGFVIVRKELRLPLPENFAFSYRIRGEAPRATLEFKLVDPDGNVWWRREPNYSFPHEWAPLVIRRSRLAFAWGPQGGGNPSQVAAIEIAIGGGVRGAGTLWIDDLAFESRDPIVANPPPPVALASSVRSGSDADKAVDGGPDTEWKTDVADASPWLQLDFGQSREFGGLVVDWDAAEYATAFDVEVSSDATEWTRVFHTETGKGGRAYIYVPDTEARFLRIVMAQTSHGRGVGIAEVTVKPVEFSDSPNAFFSAIAYDSPAGLFPKYLSGKQTYWTVVGVDGGSQKALVNQEGMVEVDRAFSIEPFLWTGDQLVTWNDVELEQELEDGALPIPSVVWRYGALRLQVTAFAAGPPTESTLYVRYRVTGDGRGPLRLFLALRPFQVLPPWQSLNIQGGVSRIGEIRWDGRAAWIDRTRAVVPMRAPDRFGAATFEDGAITEFLLLGTPPGANEVTDPFGFASGAFSFDLHGVGAGESTEVSVAVPLHAATAEGLPTMTPTRAETVQALERERWSRMLGRVDIALPPAAEPIDRTLRSTIAYILLNRDGAALQPGSRTYARSWIRDGAMEAEALLQMGLVQEVREFLRWYVTMQAPDGGIPCCVDGRGPDWTPEHDSIGAFVYGLAEYYRFTRDAGFVHDLWPNVVKAIDHLQKLRAQRMTSAYREPDKKAYFGLMPESISHEGYSGHPVHSYWDDFFAMRGLKDAAALAVVVGDDDNAAKFAALRDDFQTTLIESINTTMGQKGIDYIPASVELGDYDPTSTSLAIVTAGELERLPAAAVQNTYERYWKEIETRLGGTWSGTAYSPYELRNVGTFVRLGWRDRAHALLDYLMKDRRPKSWNEWAEVVWLDRDLPRFIGDMPHTWVGAGFVQAVRTMLVYERDSDQALVLGAGLKPEWVQSKEGVSVRRLPTHWGILNYTMRADGPDVVRLRISGDLVVPPGKIVVPSPLDRPIVGAMVNGMPIEAPDPAQVIIGASPADVELWYGPREGTAE